MFVELVYVVRDALVSERSRLYGDQVIIKPLRRQKKKDVNK